MTLYEYAKFFRGFFFLYSVEIGFINWIISANINESGTSVSPVAPQSHFSHFQIASYYNSIYSALPKALLACLYLFMIAPMTNSELVACVCIAASLFFCCYQKKNTVVSEGLIARSYF